MTYIGDLPSGALADLADDLRPTFATKMVGVFNAADYGVSASNADNSDAFDALFAAVQSETGTVNGHGGRIYLPFGVLKVSRTVFFPDSCTVHGCGNRDQTIGGLRPEGTAIQGITPGMVVAEASFFTRLHDFLIDGNDICNYGLRIPVTNKTSTWSVGVAGCLKAGYVFDGTQNAAIYDPTAKNCKVSYLFVNGAYNMTLVNASSASWPIAGFGEEPEPGDRNDADHRFVAMRTVFDDPQLSGENSWSEDNRNIRFIGGIVEHATPDYGIEISSATFQIEFWNLELGATSQRANLLLDAPCEVYLSGQVPVSADKFIAEIRQGTVHVGHIVPSGQGGKHLSALFNCQGGYVTFNSQSHTTGVELLDAGSANFTGGPGDWQPSQGGTRTWNAKKRLEFTSTSTTSGTSWDAVNQNTVGMMAQYRQVLVRFLITAITGDTQIRLNANLNVAPWNRTIGEYGVGLHEVVYECQGDEIGFRWTARSAVSITGEIAWFSAAVLGA